MSFIWSIVMRCFGTNVSRTLFSSILKMFRAISFHVCFVEQLDYTSKCDVADLVINMPNCKLHSLPMQLHFLELVDFDKDMVFNL